MSPLRPDDLNDAKKWASSLQKSHDSRKAKSKEKKYILSKADIPYSNLMGKAEKASRQQITDASRIALGKLKQLHTGKKISSEEYHRLSNKITLNTLDILNRAEAKRNRLDKKIFRGLRSAAIGFLYLTIIGAPGGYFFHRKVKIEQMQNEKNKGVLLSILRSGSEASKRAMELLEEIDRSQDPLFKKLGLREKMLVINKISSIETEFNRNLSLKEKWTIAAHLSELQKQIPEVVQYMETMVDEKDRISRLEGIFLKELKEIKESESKGEVSKCNPQFQKDIERGETFVRKDSYLQLEDKSTIPSKEDLDSTEGPLDSAIQAMHDLILPGDEHWEKILQLTVVQTNLNNFIDPLMLFWTIEKGVNNLWKENGADFTTVLDFSERSPTAVNVIRDTNTHRIVRLEIECSADLDFFRKSTTGGIEEKPVFGKDVVTGKMRYWVTLNEETGLPKVSDLKTTIETR